MIHAGIFLLSLGGFLLLMFAVARHQHDWFRNKRTSGLRRALRLSGFTALTFASIVAVTALGWSDGVLAWFGWLTIGAALAVATNTNREWLVRAFAKGRR